MRKSILALVCAPVLALGLAACTAPVTPNPTPTRTPSSTASPMPSATPTPSAEAASVVIAVEGFTILDTEGEAIAEFGYFDEDSAPAIAALAEAFGADPAVSSIGSTNHPSTNAVVSTWPGFELRDLDIDKRYPDFPNFGVGATVAEANGIAISTAEGVRVGMPLAEVEPLAYRSWVDTGTGAELPFYRLEPQLVDPPRDGDDGPAALSVTVSGDTPGGVVIRVGAPGGNFEPKP